MRTLAPRREDGEEGVALIMALGYIVVFAALMLTVLTVVVGQVKPTAQARKDIGAVNAAASGLQAGLALLRSANDGYGNGTRGLLPCTSSSAATFQTGNSTVSTAGTRIADAAAAPATVPGGFSYSVSIAYYRSDPTGQPLSWLADPVNLIPCAGPGSGLGETPAYAYLQAYGTGTDVAGAGGSTGNRGNRSQTGVYKFAVPPANIAGGHLVAFGTSMCLDAGANPQAGSALTFQACQNLASRPGQTFAYRSDLTLFYGGNPALDLCVQASSAEAPVLRRCTGTGFGATYPYAPGQQVQEWSYNDNGHFAAAANSGGVDTKCLQPAANVAGAQAVFTSCNSSISDFTAFAPDASVGAGKAGGNVTGLPGSPTSQYVNFAEFGRCLDITGQNVGASSLILYPCKQAPDSSTLTFNQVWAYTPVSGGQGWMSVTRSGVKYCLTAPSTGTYVVTPACQSGRADQLWTATGAVAGSDATSFTLVSRSLPGQCLSTSRLGMPNPPWSVIVTEACNGTTRQRWNSPPPAPDAGLSNIAEGSTAR